MVPVLGDPDPDEPFAWCPPRPTSEAPDELDFTRSNKMFRWLGPKGLLDVAMQVVLSGIFGRFADKREVEAAIPIHELDHSATPEFWFDYVADMGDGFAPTYTIARLLGQESLDLSVTGGSVVHQTERGYLLVLGGDQVYPAASERRYENQFKGPYSAALPCTDPNDAPSLVAIPGNHDWYDGLTTFMRLFCAKRWIGGWKTEQDRSYFAVKLPHRWWLWGIDIAFDFYIDDPQMSYFRSLAKGMGRDDRIILCTAKPSWVHEEMTGDKRYTGKLNAKRNLEFFEREIICKNQLSLPLVLSGDLHHYAHYRTVQQTAEGHEHRITSGGGGAFLYPTHHLPATIRWPNPHDPEDEVSFHQTKVFPDVPTSKHLRLGIPLSPFLNRSFGLVTAGIQLAMLWLVALSLSRKGGSLPDTLRDAGVRTILRTMVRSPLIVLLVIALAVGLVVFADGGNMVKRILMGLAHGLGYLGVFVASLLTWSAMIPWNDTALLLGLIGWVAFWGYVGGSLVMGIYLFLSQLGGRHPNEAFSAQHLMDYKDFLRIKITTDGSLTIYPVGVTAVPRKWELAPGGPPNAPWFDPTDAPIEAHLIEDPIVIPSL